jgi:hypothetical protein
MSIIELVSDRSLHLRMLADGQFISASRMIGLIRRTMLPHDPVRPARTPDPRVNGSFSRRMLHCRPSHAIYVDENGHKNVKPNINNIEFPKQKEPLL